MSSFAVGLDLRYDGKNYLEQGAKERMFYWFTKWRKIYIGLKYANKDAYTSEFFFISYIHVYRDRLVENLKN